MALVMTLLAVSFLVAITVQLATSVNWQMQGAGNLRDSVQLDAISRSGLSLVRAALLADLKDNKDFDTPNDSWNKLTSPSLFGQGTLDLKVTDLSGLMQVNALVPPDTKDPKFQEKQAKHVKLISLWKRLLLSGKFAVDDDAEAEKIIDSIIDWIDEDDTERDNGAEKGHYLSLSPPYAARNAPLTYLEELLLIQGMTKELFYGNDGYLALKDYLTVAGREGMININSAPEAVLMALDPDGNMTAENAKDMFDFAQDEDNMAALAQPFWYQPVNGGHDLEPDLVTVKSQYFKVSVIAKHKTMARSGTGILQRVNDKGEQKLLYWEVR